MNILYFAYGSNMSFKRISKRIINVKFLNIGQLSDYKLLCNKRSIDGSGKANIIYTPGESTWGVIYQIREDHIKELDQIEGGYTREIFKISTNKGELDANAYISHKLTKAPPTKNYKDLIISGAIENKLPEKYIEYLMKIRASD